MDFHHAFTEKVLPGMLADNVFGENMVLCECDMEDIGGRNEDHWMSDTFTITLTLRNSETDATCEKHLVVKFNNNTPKEEDYAHYDRMCANEEVMYNQIVPFFEEMWKESASSPEDEDLQLFPKCYLAQCGTPPVVVMENLRAAGYRLTASPTALDKEHVFLALRKLGRLHALSYAAKVRRRDDFMALTRLLQETHYTEEKRAASSFVVRCSLPRLERLAGRGEAVIEPAKVDYLRQRLQDSFDLMKEAVRPEEPVAVVVHGDFCRNNMLFKYDEKTGKPVDVLLFDLQTSRYCSPTVDTSFFMLMNTSSALREEHWDDMFFVYYDELSTTMRRILSSGPGMSPTVEVPSLASLKADFSRHSLFGFILCSFFLPVMAHKMEITAQMVEDVIKGGGDAAEMFLKVGGDQAADELADMLLELVERDCINFKS